MDTKNALENALRDAIRTGDDVRKRTIRLALSAIKLAEVDKQSTLDEVAIIAILHKELKTRSESLEEARKANRPDIAVAVEAEVEVIKQFLPKELGQEELQAMAQEALAEVGASSPADMGKVMKALLPRVQGRASGDRVSRIVRELLQGRSDT